MSRRPKDDYEPGRETSTQLKLTRALHEELKRQTKESGAPSMQAYMVGLIQAQKHKPVAIHEPDPFRPENRQAHQRLETLLNRLDDAQRDQLWSILQAAFPVAKGKRAS